MTEPSALGHEAHQSRRIEPLLIVRRSIGILMLILAATVLVVSPFLLILSRAMGAGGDGFQRFLIGCVLAVVLAFAIGAAGLSHWSMRTIVRSRATWLLATGVLAMTVWAALGIDSTRAVRAVPEAALSMPGAVERARNDSSAEGGLNRPARANLYRSFGSTASSDEVEAFYRTALAERGWTYSGRFTSTQRDQYLNWDRDGFTLQLRLREPPDVSAEEFTVVIYGPQQ
jgi:hypothetical protein